MTPRFSHGLAVIACLAALANPASARAGSKPEDAPPLAATGEARARSDAAAPKPGDADVAVPDEMPQPVKTVSPKYPESARARKQEGTVFVQAKVLKTGKVGTVRLARGKGVAADLDRAAIDAVRQWEFTPAKIDGKPVAVWVVVPVAFRLK